MARIVLTDNTAFAVTSPDFVLTFVANSPGALAANDDLSMEFLSGFFDKDQRIVMAGTDLEFVRGSGGLEGITGGTFRSLTYSLHDEALITITGLRVDATAFFAVLPDRNFLLLEPFIFGGSDTVIGTAGQDSVDGGGGNDVIKGLGGSDTLAGDAGRDVLRGGRGADQLTGGADDDRFVFDTAPGRNQVDTIVDFTNGDDQLRFDRAAFAGAGPVGRLDSDRFVDGTRALQDDDRFLYDQATGRLWFDRNGDDAGGATLVARLGAGIELVAADIFLV